MFITCYYGLNIEIEMDKTLHCIGGAPDRSPFKVAMSSFKLHYTGRLIRDK